MDRSDTDEAVQHIFPGWALSGELYAPYENIAKKTIVHDAGFFSKSDKGSIALSPDGQCFITAHSMGSLFALKAAVSSENVKALILFSPFARFTSCKSYEAQDHESIDVMKKHLDSNPEALLKSFWRKMAKPENLTINIPGFFNVPRLKEGLDVLANCDVRELLSEIRVPVLIFQGTGDLISSVATASFVNGNIPHSKLVMIEKAGHAIPFTKTRECIEKMKSFLAEAFQK